MGMIINPYRFGGGAAWTPPNAVLWYYGSLLSGSQWADRIGTNHGTLQGGASAGADGVECSATKYVTAASAGIETLFAGGNVLSASIWIKFASDLVVKYIILKDAYYITNKWCACRIYSDENRIWQNSMGQNIYKGNSFATYISLDTWVHIAYVYDKINSVNKKYVNGVLRSSDYTGTFVVIPSNTSDLLLGQNCTYIDDVVLSTTAWTADDIADIYNNSPATHKT